MPAFSGKAAKVSSADRDLYSKAKMQGTAYKTREEAVSAFKTKHAKDYKTTFSAEPEKRPDYIPKTTRVGDRDVPVAYDVAHGGYGYYDNGKWRMYEVFRDVAMMSLLMHHGNYYYGSGYGYGYPMYPHHSFPWGLLIFGIIAVFIISRMFRNRQ